MESKKRAVEPTWLEKLACFIGIGHRWVYQRHDIATKWGVDCNNLVCLVCGHRKWEVGGNCMRYDEYKDPDHNWHADRDTPLGKASFHYSKMLHKHKPWLEYMSLGSHDSRYDEIPDHPDLVEADKAYVEELMKPHTSAYDCPKSPAIT